MLVTEKQNGAGCVKHQKMHIMMTDDNINALRIQHFDSSNDGNSFGSLQLCFTHTLYTDMNIGAGIMCYIMNGDSDSRIWKQQQQHW